MKPALPNLKNLPYGGAQAVRDPDVVALVNQLSQAPNLQSVLDDSTVVDQFLERYRGWIGESRHNKLDISGFPISCYCLGTTEAFDKFYLRNHTRRFRCFRGEYMYHVASWRNYFPNWIWLEDAVLDTNDAVVISLPFSDTGNEHAGMKAVLERCDSLAIPVLIDCAFFGICSNMRFNFDYGCITDVTFSLSKSFTIANARVGMRITRHDDDDSLLVLQKTNYTNRLGAAIGLALVEKFSADHNIDRWRETQLAFCRQLNVMPSHTVIFGLANGTRQEYNRGSATNRLCFARYLPEGNLPTCA